jgi:hypothetical protein
VDNDSFRVHYPDRYLGYLCVVSVIWTLLCASVTVVVTVVVTRGVVPCVTVRLYNRTHTAGWCRAFFVVCPFVLVPCGKRCGKPSGSTNGSGANNRGLFSHASGSSRQRLLPCRPSSGRSSRMARSSHPGCRARLTPRTRMRATGSSLEVRLRLLVCMDGLRSELQPCGGRLSPPPHNVFV